MTKQDMRYFNIAKAVSKSSENKRIKIGAVLIRNKDILAASANLTKSHPIQYSLNPLRFDDYHTPKDLDTCRHNLHAEMECIIKSKEFDLTGAHIYVYREGHAGNLLMCRPCNACLKMIKEVGIKEIYYTTPDGYAHEIIKKK